MAKYVIAGLGEILWDVFGKDEKLGGAPANFAFHAASMGAEALAISTIGNDPRGQKALTELKNAGLSIAGIAVDSKHQTGYVEATVDSKGVAHYHFPDDVAWDHLQLTNTAKDIINKLDAVTFGTLAQRSRQSQELIHSFLQNVPETCLKVYDINLRQNFYNKEIIEKSLKLSDILKLNEEELPVLAEMFSLTGSEKEQLESLVETYQLKLGILTCGNQGSLLVTPATSNRHSGVTAEVVDTVGAGDSFTAATVIGFMQGKPLSEINNHANRVAAFVCGHQGAMVAIPDNLKAK